MTSETLQLSNPPNVLPVVHCVPSDTTETWQYIVADPSTKRCVIIDPARDYCENEITVSTTAADALCDLVVKEGYTVQYIFETDSHTTNTKFRSGAWYLRTQLTQRQGWAPDMSTNAAIASIAEGWRQRHASEQQFTTTFTPSLANGETRQIGRMRIKCLHLDSVGTPSRRALLVGPNVFGAYSLALLSSSNMMADEPHSRQVLSDTWLAMQRVIQLPEDVKVYLDLNATKAMIPDKVFRRVQECRMLNDYAELDQNAFCVRWQGRQQERRSITTPESRWWKLS